jgi:hypothetical protein
MTEKALWRKSALQSHEELVFEKHFHTVVATYLTTHNVSFLFSNTPSGGWSTGYGFDLGYVYLIWLGALVSLYPLCRWCADVKRRRIEVWLSYV